MITELKKEIVNYMLEEVKNFQLVNATVNEFRQYIYKPDGSYCIGGEKVLTFIRDFDKLISKN